jgi:hypothetical protein
VQTVPLRSGVITSAYVMPILQFSHHQRLPPKAN